MIHRSARGRHHGVRLSRLGVELRFGTGAARHTPGTRGAPILLADAFWVASARSRGQSNRLFDRPLVAPIAQLKTAGQSPVSSPLAGFRPRQLLLEVTYAVSIDQYSCITAKM